ncbi:MAG: phosphocholine cytidylyltransferase family protein [Gammaproteobacteria bacterium]|nr:phosphocholine cytidylyltransferase family protein [Gammaproteobacteria bacterium]
MMNGIILAAGRGSRMKELTEEKPKCLLSVKGKPLIQHQLDALNSSKINNISLILGYQAEKLLSYSNQFFLNHRWSETNMVYSLTMADELLQRNTCIVSYSDILYSKDTVDKLINAPGEISITYDPNWLNVWQARFENPLDDAESFQINEEGYLLSIGQKPSSIDDIQGQYMGLLKITPDGWTKIKQFICQLPKAYFEKISMTELLNLLIAKSHMIYATPIVEKWFEFDNQHDLEKAYYIENAL